MILGLHHKQPKSQDFLGASLIGPGQDKVTFVTQQVVLALALRLKHKRLSIIQVVITGNLTLFLQKMQLPALYGPSTGL